MTQTVVVLGAGYAGTGAIDTLADTLPDDIELVWISDQDYHLVLHEVHRCIRNPSVKDSITIPVDEIVPERVTFIQGEVTDIDAEGQSVSLADGNEQPYDYLLVALGSQTAFYDIPGVAEHGSTLKSVDDALAIHDQLEAAAAAATPEDPAQVVIGGAGLSGVQAAGEIAEYREIHDAPIDIVLVEALDEIYPRGDRPIQRELRIKLHSREIDILTNSTIVEATADDIQLDTGEQLPVDVFIWTGGITGQDAVESVSSRKKSERLVTDATFQTSDDRIFALGDAAFVEHEGTPLPPTAQAAWETADMAAENIRRAIEGEPLQAFSYRDKGTAISVGEDAVVHDVIFLPVETFGSLPAATLKKLIAARWIADIAGWRRAADAWADL